MLKVLDTTVPIWTLTTFPNLSSQQISHAIRPSVTKVEYTPLNSVRTLANH